MGDELSGREALNLLWELLESFDVVRAPLSPAADLNLTTLRAVALLHEQGPLDAIEIRTRMGLTAASVADLVYRLVRTGLITKARPPDRLRLNLYRVTPKGVDLYLSFWASETKFAVSAFEAMGSVRTAEFCRGISAFLACRQSGQ